MMFPKAGDLLIVCHRGDTFRLHPQQLLTNLRFAAQGLGTEGSWLAEDVAVAVWAYLHQEPAESHLRLERLQRMIQRALRHVGYPEIAETFCIMPPAQSMSLLYCARNPPLQNEADFYSRLRSQILDFHLRGARCLWFTDLLACEAELWPVYGFLQADLPKSKIVSFVRRQIGLLSWPHRFQCTIS